MKKVLSIVIAAMLLCVMVAFSVSAADENVAAIGKVQYDTVTAAIAAAKEGDTVKMIADVEEDITINKNITLEGTGPHNTYKGQISIKASNVTIQGIKFFNSYIYKSKNDAKGAYITIKNCTFSGTKNGYYPIRLDNTNGITIENCLAKDIGMELLYVASSSNNITVKDVTINGASFAGMYIAYNNYAYFENVNVLNAGCGFATQAYGAKNWTFKNCSIDEKTPVAVKINPASKAMQTIYDIGDNNFGENGLVFPGQEDHVTVIRTPYVFAIGETKYFTLNEAIAAAADGDVIKAIESYEFDKAAAIEADGYYAFGNVVDKKLTIDLNGKVIKFNCNTDGVVLGAVSVDGTGDVTLVDSSEAQTGAIEMTAGDNGIYSAICTTSADAKLTVESGRYAADMVEAGWALVYSAGSGMVTINDGDFYLGNADYDYWWTDNPELYHWIFNAAGDGVRVILVNGGTYNAEPTHYHGEVRYPTCVAPVEIEEDKWTVQAAHTPDENPATCLRNQICTVCGAEVDPIKEHTFVDYVSDNNATCSNDGTKTAECIYGCGKTSTIVDEGSAFGHGDADGNGHCDSCNEEYCGNCGKIHDSWMSALFCLIIDFLGLARSFFSAVCGK